VLKRVFLRTYLAQRVVQPWELPSIMRKHTYTGMMGSVYFALVSGLYFVYYGNTVGVSRFQWGLMGGLVSLLLLAQILSALITRRTRRRKFLWLCTALAARVARLVGVLLSLWLWDRGSAHAAAVLIVAICIAAFFEALAFPPWMSWLADIIPEREHGRFWGRRSAWIAAAIVCATVPAGLLLDSAAEPRKLHLAVAIFVVAALIGIVDLLIHGTLPEPAMAHAEPNHFLTHLLAPLRDRGFRPWLVFNTCWTFSMMLGGALCMVFFVDELELKDNFLGGTIALTVLALASGVLTASGSGRLVDRLGPKRVLLWGHLGWALLPAFWIFASPRTALLWLGASSVLAGTAATAADTAANKFITRFPPVADRAMYVAVSSCLASLAGGFGAVLAGTVLRQMRGWSWTVGGMTFAAFHLLFVASFLLRLASTLLLIRRIPEPAAEAR
jgi:MFS family permease